VSVDIDEYRKYKFLYFLNFSKAISVLGIDDRKILAAALLDFQPEGEMLNFVKGEILYKLTHEPINGGAETIQSVLSMIDKMNGGQISNALKTYFAEQYETLDEKGKQFFDKVLQMSVLPKYIKKSK
jgi:hypothetical protein